MINEQMSTAISTAIGGSPISTLNYSKPCPVNIHTCAWVTRETFQNSNSRV